MPELEAGAPAVTDALNAVLLQRIEVAPGLLIMRVAPEGWELPAFRPGQFAVLGLPGRAPRYRLADPEDEPAPPDKLIRRAYSVASSSLDRQYLEVYVILVRSGALTPRLFALAPGDRLFLGRKITGLFTLDSVPKSAHLALVATGTGLAPYMSMLRSELLCDAARKVAVLLGARHSWDLGYRGELITMTRLCPSFSYLPIISRPDDEPIPWSGPTGHVQDLWRGGALAAAWGLAPSPATTHVLLCGSPAMIEGMVALLEAEGYSEHTKKEPGQIHAERYW
ncbi:ferredoxin--NADP reductase [bacterium]|nr:ferredoxin--NADP reductase [bacterium]